MDTELEEKTTVSADDVEAYLRKHPDFFAGRDYLLDDMRFNHHTGGAVSLIERQVNVLRDRNAELRQRFVKLINNARENDRLFEMSKQLGLALFEADSLTTALRYLQQSFERDFKIDAASLILFNVHVEDPSKFARYAPESEMQAIIGGISQPREATCGLFRPAQLKFLFGGNADIIQSAVFIPVEYQESIGVLAFGSTDPKHFYNGMDTIFIKYMAEMVGRVVWTFMYGFRRHLAH